MKSCRLVIDPGVCLFWAFLLLLVPIRWMAAFFLAVCCHELLHYISLKLMHRRISEVRVGVSGISMCVSGLTDLQELICAVSGPTAGLLLLPLYRKFPEISICAWIQSCYNLLPVYPLDGGRALKCLANILFPDLAGKICMAAEWITVAGIVFIGIRYEMGSAVWVAAILLAVRLLNGKIPCKRQHLGVQ